MHPWCSESLQYRSHHAHHWSVAPHNPLRHRHQSSHGREILSYSNWLIWHHIRHRHQTHPILRTSCCYHYPKYRHRRHRCIHSQHQGNSSLLQLRPQFLWCSHHLKRCHRYHLQIHQQMYRQLHLVNHLVRSHQLVHHLHLSTVLYFVKQMTIAQMLKRHLAKYRDYHHRLRELSKFHQA